MSDELREAMIEKNFMSLGMALFETGMAWFWSDSRVRRWFDVEGYQNLVAAQASQRGVMVVGVQFYVAGARWPRDGAVPADDGDIPSA